MKVTSFFIGLSVTAAVLVAGCTTPTGFPYDPKPEPLPGSSDGPSTGSTAGIKVYAIAPDMQMCNPSVSQDTINYKGCMAWLNFQGVIPVNVPDSMKAEWGSGAALQHDRIVVCDTSNTVRWFIKREKFEVVGHIQDPEWTTDPDYITCTGATSAAQVSTWDGFVIRISDKEALKINKEKMDILSTPHLWISNDSAKVKGTATNPVYNAATGMVDRQSVKNFFGTDCVKFTFSLPKSGGLAINYIDFSDSNSVVHELPIPQGKEGWSLESALISPDGNWIVFNAFLQQSYYESYLQKLSPTAQPILIAKGASDPHWWVNPSDKSLFIIYQVLPNLALNQVINDLADPELLKSGKAGVTMRQMVKLISDRPASVSCNFIGSPSLMINLPFKGGLSPDGAFLITGYIYGFIAHFEY